MAFPSLSQLPRQMNTRNRVSSVLISKRKFESRRVNGSRHGLQLGQFRFVAFGGVVLEEFLDQVDVGHKHAPAAVPFAAEGVHGISVEQGVSDWLVICLLERRSVVEGAGLPILYSVVKHREVLFPQVSDDLGASQFLGRSKICQ